MKQFILVITSFFLFSNASAQYSKPLDIPLYLSGNFGELRNNHFHSGIDLKTQGVINKPVYSVADGYISRISVSPSGYGLALYVTHPGTGQVSVYGHLNNFTPKITAYVKEKQYEQESFRVNLFPEEGLFPVKKGELIAYSGNSGSSGGPHVHFEIRDARTENILDPLQYYKDIITDKVSPDLRAIAIYPVGGNGMVNGSSIPVKENISKSKKGDYLPLARSITAWGTIGVAVKAYDRMTGTSNIYGLKTIKLYLDKKKIFESNINSYSFDETRMLNSFVDFDDWRRNKSFFMKSFVEPGNKLSFYETVNNGYITIGEERFYDLDYELIDIYGNKATFSFQIKGKKQQVPQERKGSMYMSWNEDNHYLNDSFSLVIRKGNLYDDFIFTLKRNPSKKYLSDIFTANDTYIPFHDKGEMRIKINYDSLENKSQYGIVSIRDGRESWIGGTYADGYVKAEVREIGQRFAITYDDEIPDITPVQPERWEKDGVIKIRLKDNKSGISSFRGTIDGSFALFEHDTKSAIYTYKFDSVRLNKGRKHQLTFTATDACGNVGEYTSEFYY